ncbi:MAG: hypothetical protein ABI352_00395 [Candidatus Dormibacter sp.]
MADQTSSLHDADAGHTEHAEIHLPPNSLVPINIAFALAATFVGFVDQVRNAVGPLVWGIGLVWLIVTCVVWFFAARSEFNELPESAEGH